MKEGTRKRERTERQSILGRERIGRERHFRIDMKSTVRAGGRLSTSVCVRRRDVCR